MTIRHLKIFIEVARCGKMSKAAANLYISQPTVSQTISELEDHYKVRLFERFPKSLHITSEGKVLLQYAKRVVAALDDLENAMFRSGINPPVRIGATVTVGSCVIGDILEMLEQQCPQSDISVCINLSLIHILRVRECHNTGICHLTFHIFCHFRIKSRL